MSITSNTMIMNQVLEERTKPAGQVHQVVSLLPAPLRAGQVLCVLHLCVGWHLHNFVEPEDYYLAA